MAWLLIACVALVAFWEIMSNRSRRPFRPFQIRAEHFEGFSFAPAGWTVGRVPVPDDPLEPNILTFQAVPNEAANDGPFRGPVWVRLVHGYNMYDCMRMKGYVVELMADRRTPVSKPGSGGGGGNGFRGQVWRLTARNGERAIWATSMLRASDLEATGTDVRSMMFPRIGVPGDPGWVSEGFRFEDARHPIRSLSTLLRAKWNNARCDWPTFLGLRQPAWASDEWHTLVTASWRFAGDEPADEARVADTVIHVHTVAAAAFKRWRAAAASGQTPVRADHNARAWGRSPFDRHDSASCDG